jgi:Zn-dependent peptidase ImmA (M78 family)
MNYIPESRIEAAAMELWMRYDLRPDFDVELLLDDIGLSLLWEDIPDRDGKRVLGALQPNRGRILLNERYLHNLEGNPGLRRFTLCHECGHWIYHCGAARSGTLPLMVGDRILCRDGSSHPMEQQANLFASYLLMPTGHLREAIPRRPWTGWRPVYGLAERFGTSAEAMIIRLERLEWAHRDETGEPASGPPTVQGQGQLDLRY